jgi:3-deoxy-manno-octulosonate cytidylyltransferase (CMP-KDO synthetase)
MQVVIVIPARYASTRLPGKPLLDILGKPMILHVAERARAVRSAQRVIVATDDERIASVVRSAGIETMMTSTEHATGTDRLVEVAGRVPGDLYINLQGDEPLVRPEDVETLITGMLADESVAVGTLCHRVSTVEARDPNIVKVVLADNGNALYFSRAPIPYPRDDDDQATYLKHVGVYAFRRYVLERYGRIHQPMLEKAEKLEQLRLLFAGFRIRAFEVSPTGPGVDQPQCLERVRAMMSGLPDPGLGSLANIRLVICDIDGVLTDGGFYYNENGRCWERFHFRDHIGIQMLKKVGIQVAGVCDRNSDILCKLLKEWGIHVYRLGVQDKVAAGREIMKELSISASETAYIGNDATDLRVFLDCAISFVPADAPDFVRQAATYTLSRRGGEGAVREVAERIVSASGKEKMLETSIDASFQKSSKSNNIRFFQNRNSKSGKHVPQR